jgi:hypothetical protein
MIYNVVELKHEIDTPNPEGNGATTWSEWLVIRTTWDNPTPTGKGYEVVSFHGTEAEAEQARVKAYVGC